MLSMMQLMFLWFFFFSRGGCVWFTIVKHRSHPSVLHLAEISGAEQTLKRQKAQTMGIMVMNKELRGNMGIARIKSTSTGELKCCTVTHGE
jgi:hypothetical protein